MNRLVYEYISRDIDRLLDNRLVYEYISRDIDRLIEK